MMDAKPSENDLRYFFPATRPDFEQKAGQIKTVTCEDFEDENRRKHLEAFQKTMKEWLAFDSDMYDNDSNSSIEHLEEFVLFLATQKFSSKADFNKQIKECRKTFHVCPSNSQLLRAYELLLVSSPELIGTRNLELEKYLTKRAVRTLSGVAVITVLTSPGKFSCPKNCFYCPDEPGQPRSYLSSEPAVLRANQCGWDSARQFWDRGITLKNNGHWVDKIEVLVLGGTWSGYPKQYQTEFLRDIFYAANTFDDLYGYYQKSKLAVVKEQAAEISNNESKMMGYANFRPMKTLPAELRPRKSLEEEQLINETASVRIIGLTLETRPDYISISEIRNLRRFGCTRVQLGIQHTKQEILDLINRGCSLKTCEKAITLLKNSGFKVDIHLMPDLPGSNPELDLDMFHQCLTSPALQVDQWKIYPCEVTPFSVIEKWYKAGTYIPYAEKTPAKLLSVILKVKKCMYPWIRLNRVVRDIPNQSIIAGNKITNLRQIIESASALVGLSCKCIRCREIKFNQVRLEDTKFVVRSFDTVGGEEYFLSFETVDESLIVGFLRLRLPKCYEPNRPFSLLDRNCALVRELHIYGTLVGTAQKKILLTDGRVQHSGFGRRLLLAAELLSMSQGYTSMAIISGIGVRKYYEKFGYTENMTYMYKKLPVILGSPERDALVSEAEVLFSREMSDNGSLVCSVKEYNLETFTDVRKVEIDEQICEDVLKPSSGGKKKNKQQKHHHNPEDCIKTDPDVSEGVYVYDVVLIEGKQQPPALPSSNGIMNLFMRHQRLCLYCVSAITVLSSSWIIYRAFRRRR